MSYVLSAVDQSFNQDISRTLFIRETQLNDRQKQSSNGIFDRRTSFEERNQKRCLQVIFLFQGGYLEHIFTFAAKEASHILFVES